MKSLFFFVLCFLYILGPILNTALGTYGDPILFISFILSICLFITKYDVNLMPSLFIGKYEKGLYLFQFYIFFPLIVAVILPSYGEGITLSDIVRPIRIILTLYSGLFLSLFAYKIFGLTFFEKILKVILYVMITNAIVMLFQSISLPFRSFMEESLYRIDDGVDRYGIELRSSGLFLSGGALPSVFQTLSILFIPYLVKKKHLSFSFGIMIAIFLLLTSILTGRTGLLTLLPFLYLSYIFLPRRFFCQIILSIMAFLIILFSYLSIIDSDAIIYALERLSWLGNESSESGTVVEIFGKLSLPHNVFIFLFGVLNFNNAIYTQVSDMGFNINLWTYGIIGFILFYSVFVKFLFIVYKKTSVLYKDERFLVLLFLLTYLFFEFKENMMYARNGLSILSLIFYSYLIYQKKVVMENKCNVE